MPQSIIVSDLMNQSGVAFGTSGARGLAEAISNRVAFVLTLGFLQYLTRPGVSSAPFNKVALGLDLRPSSPRILQACATAALHFGITPINCGEIPTPALMLYGLQQGIPTIMVTGSHIPEERNGIKFTLPTGEILKPDEAGIKSQVVELPDGTIDAHGEIKLCSALPLDDSARQLYLQRYLSAAPERFLNGKTLAVYQHSAVGRDILVDLYTQLGAVVYPVGRSDSFVSIDTEAIRPQDHELARMWATQSHQAGKIDAILSADGDCDRPLVADEQGYWLRGDILGIIAARALDADAVVAPISCNTALEKSAHFAFTKRTKIGSPHVIAAMQESIAAGYQRIVGYEANGGFLTGSALTLVEGCTALSALPTRDAILPQLALLALSIRQKKLLSELVATLPQRYTASERVEHFPTAQSQEILAEISNSAEQRATIFPAADYSAIVQMDTTDGLRMTFENGSIIHLRPSGNAPEFRCYVETESKPEILLGKVLKMITRWRGPVPK